MAEWRKALKVTASPKGGFSVCATIVMSHKPYINFGLNLALQTIPSTQLERDHSNARIFPAKSST